MKFIIFFLFIIVLFFFYKIKYESFADFNRINISCIKQKNIFVVWTGTNPLTKNRKESLNCIRDESGCNIILVTPSNLSKFVVKNYPIHQGYKYLSRIHKSDYLRCYLMHHHGGGYSDLKRAKNSWVNQFNRIEKNKNIWIIGLGGGSTQFGIAKPEEYSKKQYETLCQYHNKMVGVSYMICRPNTPFTKEWFKKLTDRMDQYYSTLKKHPAVFSREAYDRPPKKWCLDERDPKLKKIACPKQKTKYPIGWNRLLGQIVYPLQVKYLKHVKMGLPEPNRDNYN